MSGLSECSNEYLRDSVAIFEGLEIDANFRDAAENAPSSEFTPLGPVWCSTLDCNVFVGIKKRGVGIPFVRPLEEIAVVQTLLNSSPTYHRNLPIFTLGLRDEFGPLGILTEDFSENGKLEVKEDKFLIRSSSGQVHPNLDDMPTELHRKVCEALGGVSSVDIEALSHMSSTVCGNMVLVDFNSIAIWKLPDYHSDVPAREEFRKLEDFQDLAYVEL